MRVVLAGGSGLLGGHLTRALLTEGHEPVVLTRDPARAGAPLPHAVQVVAWHPPELGGWTRDLARADAIINLAGESVGTWPWTERRKRMLRESRLVPTRTIVRALASIPSDRRPPVLLNASGTDIYEGRDAQPAEEGTSPADTFLAGLCLDWEAEAHLAKDLGVRVVCLRFSLVVANRAPALMRVALPFRYFLGGPIGSGRQWMSWVDVGDAVRLALFALDRADISGPLNVAAPDPRPQAEFARALAAAMSRPCWFRTPAWLVRLILSEQATLILGSRRVWPGKALAAGYAFRQPRLESALAGAL